jgi:hypothetical protein
LLLNLFANLFWEVLSDAAYRSFGRNKGFPFKQQVLPLERGGKICSAEMLLKITARNDILLAGRLQMPEILLYVKQNSFRSCVGFSDSINDHYCQYICCHADASLCRLFFRH